MNNAMATNVKILIGITVLSVVLLVRSLAPYIIRYDPGAMNMSQIYKPPSLEHLFGTDRYGRDVLSRVVYGAGATLGLAAAVSGMAGLLGTTIGLLAGFYNQVDVVMMPLMDMLMTMPSILLAIALVAFMGASALNAFIALSIVYTPRTARIIRASVLEIKQETFIEAARAVGGTDIHIILRHILPNVCLPIIIQVTFLLGYAAMISAGLSFVGAGVPPTTPDLGNLVAEGRVAMSRAPWVVVFPGFVLTLITIAVNLLGEGLRERAQRR